MEISPQRVRTAQFKTVKKGFDPDEVTAFLEEVASELERAQNQSTAMEARARAAVARLQEISDGAAQQTSAGAGALPLAADASDGDATGRRPLPRRAPEAPPEPEALTRVDEAETISRTLLLAQRTADTTIADAEAEAEQIRSRAEDEARQALDSTAETTERMVADARDEARQVGDSERQRIESEVSALMARRDFLESDVDHLETFLVEQRGRLREAASSMLDLADRVPGGLGEVRRPLLSAADDEDAVDEGAVDEGAVDEGDAGGEPTSGDVFASAEDGPDDVVPGVPGDGGAESADEPSSDGAPLLPTAGSDAGEADGASDATTAADPGTGVPGSSALAAPPAPTDRADRVAPEQAQSATRSSGMSATRNSGAASRPWWSRSG